MRSREATIAAAARALGFSRAGTAPLAPIPVGPFVQAWLAEGRAAEMGYLARRTAERIDPRAARPWARAVISLAYPYRPPPPPPGDWRATLFFFQAEDGIRDLTVTGVQTCALPI